MKSDFFVIEEKPNDVFREPCKIHKADEAKFVANNSQLSDNFLPPTITATSVKVRSKIHKQQKLKETR